MYDICIVGAGPGGSTLARLIGRKYKVLLLDKRNLDNQAVKNNKNKCCGGLLAPDAQKMFAELGLGIPKEILVDPQLFSVRTIDINTKLERYYQRFYFNMDREKFDKWLVSLIPKEVDISFNSVYKEHIKTEKGYEVKYSIGEKKQSAKCRIIVGADGAFSKIRRLISNEKNNPKTYISIQEWFRAKENIPFFTAIFDKDISDFYSWIIPKEKNMLLGAALSPNDNPQIKFNMLKERLKEFGFNLTDPIKKEGAFIYRPTRLSHFFTGIDNIALIGEAAGAISPSSAEGFSYALRSAIFLSKSLDSGIDGFLKRYNKEIKTIKRNILLKNIKSIVMYKPFLRKIAMRSGFESMNFPLEGSKLNNI